MITHRWLLVVVASWIARTAAAAPVSPPADWRDNESGRVEMGVETVGRQSVLRGIGNNVAKQEDVSLRKSMKYVATVRVMGVNTSPSSKAQMIVRTTQGTQSKQFAVAYDPMGDEWQTLRIDLQTGVEPNLATFELAWEVAASDAQGSFLFTEASLQIDSAAGASVLVNGSFKKTTKKVQSPSWTKLVIPPPAKLPKDGEYVVNGAFEAAGATPKGWEVRKKVSDQKALVLATTDCHGGKACVEMKIHGMAPEPALFAQRIAIRPGKNYRLTAWVKMLDAKDLPASLDLAYPATVRLALPNSGRVETIRVARETTTWTQVTVELAAAPRDTTAVIELDGYVKLDEISLIEIAELTKKP